MRGISGELGPVGRPGKDGIDGQKGEAGLKNIHLIFIKSLWFYILNEFRNQRRSR